MVKQVRFAFGVVLLLFVGMVAAPSCTAVLGIDTSYGDNPCSELPDGSAKVKPCGKGACFVLQPECDEKSLPNPCNDGDPSAKADEICDGTDNNCNGAVDENCTCEADTTKACFRGSLATRGIGLCTDGTQKCIGTTWGPCSDDVLPTQEQCNNGRDDNCNGAIDEGCPCTPNQKQPCYSNHENTLEHGLCQMGIQTCQDNSAWGDCIGEVSPHPEICNNIDDDCDGTVDNNRSPACICHKGSDCSSGKCNPDGTCVPQPTCSDSVTNGKETDTDCGGGDCDACNDGQKCLNEASGPLDCKSKVCKFNQCQKATCTDNVQNGIETDSDCGGGTCPRCGPARGCKNATDCSSGICTISQCTKESCVDGVLNGEETDKDCGGICPPCAIDQICKTNEDCKTETCSPLTKTCIQAGLGTQCKSDVACTTNHCVDGRCCETACTSICHKCDESGQCVFFDKDQTDTSPPCEGTHACDGKGNCLSANGQPCGTGNQCASGSCADNVCCDTACTAMCYACNVSNSVGKCIPVPEGIKDSSCDNNGTKACSNLGACLKSNGQTCASNSDCASDNCVDGVCCDSVCTSNCTACSAAKKGSGSDGVCGNVAINAQDPKNTCSLYTCNGNGACVLNCNKDADCVPGSFCSAGSCKNKQSPGMPCTNMNQCLSGNCVDGVCCTSPTCGVCQGCNVNGMGTCTNYASGLDPKTSCGLYRCDGNGTCSSTCNTVTECAPGSYCASPPNGHCASLLSQGTSCSNGTQCASGFCIDGVCCNTNCNGTCQTCNGTVPGICVDTPLGGNDTNPPCGGNQACNGKGVCVSVNGMACSTYSNCTSGFCVDGVCCNNACNGACKSCNIGTSVGTCSDIPQGGTDTTPACSGSQACDGKGSCLLGNGQACNGNNQCASGLCIDGVCCNTPCNGTCQTCNGPTPGMCSNIPLGGTDTAPLCSGTSACNGSGQCVLVAGMSCNTGADCATGLCVDGMCCNTQCIGPCQSCALPGSPGTCTNIPLYGTDANPACLGTSACDGNGHCAAVNGQACTTSGNCASGLCIDGVCCNTQCNGMCQTCNGTVPGTCSNIPAGQADGTPICSGTTLCNGAGDCLLVNGQTCTSSLQCASGFCADGVCCNTACNGTCQSCALFGSVGSCQSIAAGQTDNKPVCSGTQACNGAGTCVSGSGLGCTFNTQCATGNCINGVCCTTSSCLACNACNLNGSGTCSPVPAQTANASCGLYTCNGAGGCLTSCGVDADCATGTYCTMSSCAPKRSNSQTCSASSQCASGYCVDGVCCGSPVCPTCFACNVNGQGSCAPMAVGQDTTPPNQCNGAAQTCNSAGQCVSALGHTCTQASDCLSGYCVDGVCCSATSCLTCQTCNGTTPGSCTNIPSGQSDTNPTGACAGTSTCDGNGSCKQLQGQSCFAPTQCMNGNCVDGFCCDLPCTGNCQACSNALTGQANGTCSPISAGSVAKNSGCTPAPPCGFDGTCDGAGYCRNAPSTTQCIAPTCAGGTQTNAAQCTGFGTCPTATTASCGTYACGSTACKTSPCMGDSDCATGNYCLMSGTCTAKRANGSSCASNNECLSGACVGSGSGSNNICCQTSCSTGFACSTTSSTCNTSCTTDAQCVSGYYCTNPGPSGNCAIKNTNGTACTANNECTSGFCIDGVCCGSASCNSCETCNGSTPGTCTTIAAGQPDNNPTGTCTGNNTCDGKGVCRQSCTATNQCSSGNCVDGFCCATASCPACQACTGNLGTCVAITIATDSTPANICRAQCSADGRAPTAEACNTGTCTVANGTTCTNNFQCDPEKAVCYAGPTCISTSQCAMGYVCSGGRCLIATGKPYTNGVQTCTSNHGTGGMCKACQTASDCPSCSNGVCLGATSALCSTNAQCANNQCQNGTCASTPVSGGTLGTPCVNGTQCASGLSCSSTINGVGGFCLISNTTTPCSAATDCPSNLCSATCQSCTSSNCSGTCSGIICQLPVGSTCSVDRQCESSNCVNGVCLIALGKTLLGTTEECQSNYITTTAGPVPVVICTACTSSVQCPSGATCVSGVCQVKPGSPCKANTQCKMGTSCVSGLCKVPNGRACSISADCASGTCDFTTGTCT